MEIARQGAYYGGELHNADVGEVLRPHTGVLPCCWRNGFEIELLFEERILPLESADVVVGWGLAKKSRLPEENGLGLHGVIVFEQHLKGRLASQEFHWLGIDL